MAVSRTSSGIALVAFLVAGSVLCAAEPATAPLGIGRPAAVHDIAAKDLTVLADGTGDKPILTVGSYWPYATTLFDYIRRAMPYQGSGELSANDTYALAAWILAENKIVKPKSVLTEQTLPRVQMPNKEGFEDAATAK